VGEGGRISMLPVNEIKVYLEDGLTEQKTDMNSNEEGYITTYCLPLSFYYKEEEWIGELLVYFKVIGFGIEGFDGGVDTYFHVPAFSSSIDGEEYFEDAEAFKFIFSNFGEEIQETIDEALDELYDYYEEGIKKHSSLHDYIASKSILLNRK